MRRTNGNFAQTRIEGSGAACHGIGMLRFLPLMLVATPALAQTAPMTATAAATTDDPYIWLEDKDGAKPLAWVEAENRRTLARLESDPRYKTFNAEAFAIASAQDRIPLPRLIAGRVTNLWRDEAHPQGIWRWTTPESYATATPQWTTLIDLDALSKAEGKKWVWKGAVCLQPDETRCLVALSEGGEDATTLREFDLTAGRFVTDGFVLPTSKQEVDWIDADTLIVSRDWGPGTLTKSTYPFVVKLVKRGQPLAAAKEVYRGSVDDIGTGGTTYVDAKGNRAVVIGNSKTFFESEHALLTEAGLKPIPLPAKANVVGLVDGRLVVRVSEAWRGIPEGALAALPLAQATDPGVKPELIFAPGPRQSVDRDNITVSKSAVVAAVYDNVRGRIMAFTPGTSGWQGRALALPDNLSTEIESFAHGDDRGYVSVTGFTTPTRLIAVDVASDAAPAVVKTSPARFDATGLVVDQFEAASSDGTKVPYFVVHRKDAPLDGSTPTLMTAYGGFDVAMTPYYSGVTGKLWLERGGAFVLANIRGGGEFGPKWHEAGRKTKRQIIYDDFAGVARDLFARRITSAKKLGIYGGSNGGLLMGVELTQHPELWGAVTIAVPLLDMVRYEQIAAGASWVDEYGSVSVPEERAFLAKISPYANLKRGVVYPEPYIWTTTKDDRVGPQQARKFAARMKEYGLPYLFYEDTAGGHSGDADIAQGARLQALQAVYFTQKLVD
jgi:prolyl oligopeptidase